MTKSQNLFLDLHVIQSLPPSNVNRDDTGSPKTAQYGGVTRSRVSSQSWKKAIRDYFNDNGELSNVGVRSLEIVRYIADKIINIAPSTEQEEAMKMANDILKKAGISTKDNKVKALFFISSKQAEALAQAAIDGVTDKQELKAILNSHPAIDIALFGRMVAEDPSLNADASSQVAHAISTHAVQTEFDFYTATDDFSSSEDAGAGMLGTIEYNSSTLYRYANIAIHDFIKQVNGLDNALPALSLFIEAFVKSMPTGKVNTFANQTLPDAILVTVNAQRPVNLVTAFEKPVKSNNGYAEESIKQLINEYDKVQQWVDEPDIVLSVGLKEFDTNEVNLTSLIEKFETQLKRLIEIE